jgi:mRNA interferase MazF
MPVTRGDIYLVNLNPVKGREQAGQRPVLVLSIDAINRLPLSGMSAWTTMSENSTSAISRSFAVSIRLTIQPQGVAAGDLA